MRFGVQLGMLPPEEQFALVRRVKRTWFSAAASIASIIVAPYV